MSSPADCSLLLAIPVNRAAFLSDLTNPTKDFVKQFQMERRNLTEDALWRAYEPYSSLVADVSARTAQLGVRVKPAATLTDLHASIAISPVTTLVAHWRSALFRPEDIVAPASVAAYLGNGADSDTPSDLAAKLNSILNEVDRRFDDVLPDSDGEAAARQRKWHVRRLELESELKAAVQGGAAIEFAGGFQTIRQILTRFPPEFNGVLDLTVCQSVLLAEEVRARCRHCLVLSSVHLTSLDFRLALYGQIIEVLARQPQPFEETVLKVRKALIKRYAKRQTKNH